MSALKRVYANRLSLYCPDYSIVRGFSECPQASLFGCIVNRLLIYLCFSFILLPFCVEDAYPTFLGICKLKQSNLPTDLSYIPPTFLGICKLNENRIGWLDAIYPLRFWVYANRLSLYYPDYSVVRGFSECLQASLFGCIVSRLLIHLCFPFLFLCLFVWMMLILRFWVYANVVFGRKGVLPAIYPLRFWVYANPFVWFVIRKGYIPPTFLGICKPSESLLPRLFHCKGL